MWGLPTLRGRKSHSTNEFWADFLWIPELCKKSFLTKEKPDAVFLKNGVWLDGLHKWKPYISRRISECY
jgi:hypothetical protein